VTVFKIIWLTLSVQIKLMQ